MQTQQEFFIGELHICANFNEVLSNLTHNKDKENLRILYPRDENGKEQEFKIDNAREVIAHAYIACSQVKTLILCAPKYRIEAQNALLKILEEPPINTQFIMIAPSKNALLPTIISRLRIITYKDHKELPRLELDLCKLDLKQIYNFLQDCNKQHRSVQEVKERIQALLLSAHKHQIPLGNQDLQAFDKAIKQADCFVRESLIFAPLLLKVRSAVLKARM